MMMVCREDLKKERLCWLVVSEVLFSPGVVGLVACWESAHWVHHGGSTCVRVRMPRGVGGGQSDGRKGERERRFPYILQGNALSALSPLTGFTCGPFPFLPIAPSAENQASSARAFWGDIPDLRYQTLMATFWNGAIKGRLPPRLCLVFSFG